MPIDSTGIESQIDSNLPDNTSRQNGASVIRFILKIAVRWVRDAINGNLSTWLRVADAQPGGTNTDHVYRTGKTFFGRTTDDGSNALVQATTVSVTSLGAKSGYVTNFNNGLRFNQDFGIGPSGTDAFRYIKIAILPLSSGGLRDILRIQAVMGLYSSANRGQIDVTMGNRDGFSYMFTQQGDLVGCGIAAYSQANVGVVIYLKIQNDFRCGNVNIVQNVQDTVYESWLEEVPSGTLVFDSTNTATYPPLQSLTSNVMAVRSFIRTGVGNSGFKITGVKSGSSLSLKTSRYLELTLEDGTVVKVAEVN